MGFAHTSLICGE
jgi:hypothetical protein